MVPVQAEATLSWNEWEAMGGPNGKLSRQWLSIVAGKLAEINPHCSFAFKKSWLKKPTSNKQSTACFRAQGYCTFADCGIMFKASIQSYSASSPPRCLQMNIYSSGCISHKLGEKKARYVREPERQHFREILQHRSPSSLYNERYLQLSPSRLYSGNRDGVGRTISVYQQLSSEAKRAHQHHSDMLQSLHLLKEDLESQTVDCDLKGYIQRIHASPFGIMCYTEYGVRIYHHMVKRGALYCDATGTLVTFKGTGTSRGETTLYYALVVQHPHNFGPVAVAELISTEHTVNAICHFLECFRRAEATLYGWRNITTPCRVVIDRSNVLLYSFLRVYNLESLSDYLHRCFRVVTGCGEECDYKGMFVFACISHVMKSAKDLCKKLL